jgi:hypothetical protein
MKKYILLAPMLICLVFLILFIQFENKYNVKAFENIADEKISFFNKLLQFSVAFQIDDKFLQNLRDGKINLEEVDEHAFVDYHVAAEEILTDKYTFAMFDVDSITLTSKYQFIKQLPQQDTSFIRESHKGLLKMAISKTGDDKYWLLGITDGNMIRNQTRAFTVLVVLLLSVTLIINLLMIFLLNKNNDER